MSYFGASWTTNGPDPDDPTAWPGYDPQGQQKWLGQESSSAWNPMEAMGGLLGNAAPFIGGAMALPAMFGSWMGQQGAGQQSQQPSLESLDPAEAQRQLRMYRARQQYERNFGMASPAGSSHSVGNPEDLLRRVRQARQEFGWRPGQGY